MLPILNWMFHIFGYKITMHDRLEWKLASSSVEHLLLSKDTFPKNYNQLMFFNLSGVAFFLRTVGAIVAKYVSRQLNCTMNHLLMSAFIVSFS